MMVEIGKEYRFTLNFDMPWPFTPTKNGVIAQNGEQPIRLPNGLLYPRLEVEQRTHSGDEIGNNLFCFFSAINQQPRVRLTDMRSQTRS